MTLPVNLPELFSDRLREMRRPPDGLLHASSDLVGSLRHSQLRAAGAPEKTASVADEIVLMTGTLWHDWAHQALVASGLPFMQEVKLTPWLPEGWAGTADWVFFDPERGGFVLGDMKTIKGSGVQYIAKDGAKQEHLWQLSAYWHALYDMGLPLVQAFGVLYWPKDRGDRPDSVVEPVVQECEPLDREEVHSHMAERWDATKAYLANIPWVVGSTVGVSDREWNVFRYLNDELAPEQDRIQKVVWSKDHWDVKLVPHWSARFCPFPTDLCSCSEQGETKIGTYKIENFKVEYVPRKGYEDIDVEVEPPLPEIRRRLRESNEQGD